MKKLISLSLILGSIMATLLLTACSSPTPGNPELPPGFQQALIPNVDVNAYAYAATDTPFQLSENLLTGQPVVTPPPGTIGLPPLDVNVKSISTLAGTSVNSFGALATLTDVSEANLAKNLLDKQTALWSNQSGSSVSIVNGTDTWAQSLKDAYTNNSGTTIDQKYPDVWNLIRLLPASPPDKPIAAGFIRTQGLDLTTLSAKAGISASNITDALNTMKAHDIAFAVYAPKNLATVPKNVDASFFKSADLGAIFVTKSSYPGFIFSLAVNVFGGGAGLQKTTIGNTDVRFLQVQDFYVYIVNEGNVLFGAISPNQDFAQKLMLSALGK